MEKTPSIELTLPAAHNYHILWEATGNAAADRLVREGEVQLNSGFWERARLSFSRALELAPNHPGAQCGFDLAQGDMKRAAAAEEERSPEAMVRKAEEFVRYKVPLERALPLFCEAAEFFHKTGQKENYVKVSDRILYLSPGHPPVAQQAARHHIDSGDPGRALTILRHSFMQDPEDTTTLNLVGEAFECVGAPNQAINSYREAARLYQRKGNRAGRDAALDRILALRPDDPGAQKRLV